MKEFRAKSKAAFTLMDLLTAVAILGILVAIALPKLSSARARARQAGLKTELTQAYTALKNFKQLYKTYHWDLPALGFSRIGADCTTTVGNCFLKTGVNSYHYAIYVGSSTAGVPAITTLGLTATYYNATWGFEASRSECSALSIAGGTSITATDGTMAGTGAAAGVSSTTFDLRAIGCPLRNFAPGILTLDRWRMQQTGVLSQLNNGVDI